MSELKDAALNYVSYGFSVCPIRPKSKIPATKHGLKDASSVSSDIEKWWGQHPDCNIAICTGQASGNIVVVDIDVDKEAGKDGRVYLNKWEEQHKPLAETVSAITGRGGIHLYYRVSNEQLRNTSNEKFAIDIRADGGYVMAPPSVHPNGNSYRWIHSPESYQIAEADENTLEFIKSIYPSSSKSSKCQDSLEVPDKQCEGGRNNTLFKMAASLQAQSMPDDVIRVTIHSYNETHCNPPLPKGEVEALLSSALGYDKGLSEEAYNVKNKGKQQQRFDHTKVSEKLIKNHHACYIDGAPAIWTGKCYEVGNQAIEKKTIELTKTASSNNRREVLKYLEIMAPRVEMADKKYIAFNNCVLDIETMETQEMTPDLKITNIIPHNWNPDARSDVVYDTLSKIACYDPDVLGNLFETIGLCMYRGTEFSVCPILTGDGSNGKSTFLNMIYRIIGKENISNLDIATIGERFQTVPLMGKLANIGDDIANDFINGTKMSVVKKVITGDYVSAEYKGGSTFTFKPYVTLVFSCNEIPKIGDSSYGVMRRLFPIEFKAKFSRNDPDFNPNIERDLSTEEAMEAAIVYGIAGLKKCILQNGMSHNKNSDALIKDIELDNNTVLAFLDDHGDEAGAYEGVCIASVYADYKDYCDMNGVSHVGQRKFTDTVCKRYGFKSKSTQRNGRHMRVFKTINQDSFNVC